MDYLIGAGAMNERMLISADIELPMPSVKMRLIEESLLEEMHLLPLLDENEI